MLGVLGTNEREEEEEQISQNVHLLNALCYRIDVVL